MPSAAVLVPLRGFAAAKVRLASALDAPTRASLAKALAERVLEAAGGLPVFVATDDDDVAAWAAARDAHVVSTIGLDLNGSVARGLGTMRAQGIERLIVAHGDLPSAAGLWSLAYFGGVTLVPDRREDGTNVVCVPASAPFEPAYGPGSFPRHLAAVRAAGLAVRIARRPELQWDVDVPDDVPDHLLVTEPITS